jgi:DNA processing protein
MDEFKTFQNIYSNLDVVAKQLKIVLNNNIKSIDIDKEFELLLKNKVLIITCNHNEYPSILKEIYRPPLGLYVKGNLTSFNTDNNLAVIGSRKATNYGKMATEKIIKELSAYNINIVSGLAIGIDTCAHT